MHRVPLTVLLGCLALVLLLGLPAIAAIERVSLTSAGAQANGASGWPVISADGRYVAFQTSATNLDATDTNGVQDIYVYDRNTDTVARVSRGVDDAVPNGVSQMPCISADGRYVAYASAASNLTANDTNGAMDVFRYDRNTGTTICCSVISGTATLGASDSYVPAISGNGRHVFYSTPNNLDPNYSASDWKVFGHDCQTNVTSLICLSNTGQTPSGGGCGYYYKSIASNDDGSIVAFAADATNLVTGDTNGKVDVFVRNRTAGTTILASRTDAALGNNGSYAPWLSADGNFLAFQTYATNFGGTDANGVSDIYWRDLRDTALVLVSTSTDGGFGNGTSDVDGGISNDGRYVLFHSAASNLVANDTNGQADIFLRDVSGQSTIRINVNKTGTQANNGGDWCALAGDVLIAAFESYASNLVTDDTNSARDIFVYLDAALANTAPVASNVEVTTHMNTPVSGTLSATDADGDPLTFAASLTSETGSIVLDDPATGAFTYTPDANQVGDAVVNFTASDAYAASNTAKLTIHVTNTAPVATNVETTTKKNTPVSGYLTASDADEDPLTYTAQLTCDEGTLVLDDAATGAFTFTPTADTVGTAILTFSASDGQSSSDTVTLTITIEDVPEPPVAENGTATGDEDTPIAITLVATDTNGDDLTYTVGAPAHGALTGDAPNLTYTPAVNWHGTDSFTFTANDGTADSNTATVTITVRAVNDPPTATAKSFTTLEGALLTGTLTGADIDSDTLSFAVSTNGTLGTLEVTDAATGAFTYTPNTGANGTDTVMVTASDGKLTSAPAAITIVITPVNDPPVAMAGKVTTPEDVACTGLLNGRDPDGDAMTFTVDEQAKHGVVEITDAALGLFRYTPEANYNGGDTFAFTVSDGLLSSAPAIVSINVLPVNDAPTAENCTATTLEDTAVTGRLSGNDVDGMKGVTFRISVNGLKGRLTLTDSTTGAYSYTPYKQASGEDVIQFDLFDGKLASTTATLTIAITEVNDVPVAVADSFDFDPRCLYAGYLPVARNDYDLDGDVFTITAVTQPAHGTVTIDNAYTVHYVPQAAYAGADAFTYTIDDGRNGTAIGTVTIAVKQSTNQKPTTADDKADVPYNTETAIAVLANDRDPEGDPLTITAVTPALRGTVRINGDLGVVVYTPEAKYTGPDAFTYTIADGNGGTATGRVAVLVGKPNSAPTAVDDSAGTFDVLPVVIFPLRNDMDPEGDKLLITNAAVVLGDGKLYFTGDAITYTPLIGRAGTARIAYTISDGRGGAATAFVMVTINLALKAVRLTSGAITTSVDAQKRTIWNVPCTAAVTGAGSIRYSFQWRFANSQVWNTVYDGTAPTALVRLTQKGAFVLRVIATARYGNQDVTVTGELPVTIN